MKKGWLKEVARDLIAIGGVPFFVIVLLRIWILDTPAYLAQLFIAGSLFLFFTFIFRNSIYSGLSLIALFFTSLVYEESRYTILGGVAYVILIGSLFYLKKDWKKILLGILFGAISAGISYYVVKQIFS